MRITNPSDGIPSAALIYICEETATGGVGVCEDSENYVNELVVVPSVEPVSVKCCSLIYLLLKTLTR